MITFQYKIPKSSHFKNFSNYRYQRYFEYQYTKMDLFKYLNITKKEIFNSEQIMSGIIFLKNNNYSLNILNKWEEMLKYNNLINDAKSLIPNHNSFIEHRHDQSVFSLMIKTKVANNDPIAFKILENRKIYRDNLLPHLKDHPI